MASRKIPVIIDTDGGVDDTLAILLALSSPELDVLAIIITFGNTDAHSSFLNVLKIYQAIARHIAAYPDAAPRFAPAFTKDKKTILAVGEDGPLAGELHTAAYFHGRDGLSGITQRHPELNVEDEHPSHHPQLEISTKSGVEVVLDLVRSEPERSLTYIVLGPLTTLAKALRADGGAVRQRLGRVVCMGGALDVPGNTSASAEFNFFADPYAVKELLVPESPLQGFPHDRFFLVPLDITTVHELPFPTYKTHIDPAFGSTQNPSRADQKSPLTHFTSSFLERTREIMVEFGKDVLEMHDGTAVWCALENPPTSEKLSTGWSAVRRVFDVERTGELTRGMLVVDRRSEVGAYAPGVNRAQVQAELEKHHIPHRGEFESTAVPAQVEVETKPPQDSEAKEGVPVITKTPGTDVFLKLLFERIWGVQLI